MSYFIKLGDGTQVRKTVLESSKASLHILKHYQRMLETRSRKATMLKGLRREMKELTMLLNHVEELLPTLTKGEVAELRPILKDLPSAKKQKMPAMRMDGPAVYLGKAEERKEIPAAPREAPKKVYSREEIHEEREKSELEKLEEKLQTVEKKLKGL